MGRRFLPGDGRYWPVKVFSFILKALSKDFMKFMKFVALLDIMKYFMDSMKSVYIVSTY